MPSFRVHGALLQHLAVQLAKRPTGHGHKGFEAEALMIYCRLNQASRSRNQSKQLPEGKIREGW